MSTISTLSTLQKSISSRTAIADQDRQVAQARQELTTGLKQDVFGDKSFRGAQTLDLRNRMARAGVFATTNRLLSGKLDIVSDRLTAIRAEAQSFQALATSISAGTQGRQVLKTEAQAMLQNLSSQLNTVYGGEYLFSGQDAASASFALPAGGIAAAELPLGADATQTLAAIADLDAYFGLNGATSTTPSYGTQVYGGSAERPSARLDENVALDYGLSADDEAVRHLIKGLSMFAQTDVNLMSDPAAYEAWTKEANQALNKGIIGLQNHEVDLGSAQALVGKTIERQDALQVIYNNRVMDIEGVDQFEVATRLEALSAQLEASYAVTVRLKSLSLLNFMR